MSETIEDDGEIHWHLVYLGIVDGVEQYAVDAPTWGMTEGAVLELDKIKETWTPGVSRCTTGTIEQCMEWILAIVKLDEYDPFGEGSPFRVIDTRDS